MKPNRVFKQKKKRYIKKGATEGKTFKNENKTETCSKT